MVFLNEDTERKQRRQLSKHKGIEDFNCLWASDGDNPNLCGPERTAENYDAAVERLQTEDTPDAEGVKRKSVFNSLKYFNVCQPGLPPCQGHDIFEGVLSYDVALYVKYFIKKKAWFTYSSLNLRINSSNTVPLMLKLVKQLNSQDRPYRTGIF
ncbi:hypothetical protein JOB18_032948 [Solea senegalensis]|uniref:Uncharacterized protein n=1 Tax=Solea senegalensis TaxID=28829 RepID=A0AAV6P9R2_SOLSE|nr:hypothetical protein JOB18_032948 [Solea senegalensis]